MGLYTVFMLLYMLQVVLTEKPADGQDGCQYYEQYLMIFGWIKLGQFICKLDLKVDCNCMLDKLFF